MKDFYIKSKHNFTNFRKQKNRKDFPVKKCKICNSTERKLRYSIGDYNVVECNKCGVIFLDLHKDYDISKLYSSDYYLERKEYYLKNCIVDPSCRIENPNILDFKEGLNLIESFKKTGRLLDVGCGMGIFLYMSKERGWEVFGVDVSDYAANFAKERFGIDCFVGRLKKANFPDNYFDVITLWDVIEHFENPIEELEEIRRILSDEGIILFDTPNVESLMRQIAHWIYMLTGGIFKYPVKKLYHQYHLYYYSIKTLKTLLNKSGFEIVKMKNKTIPLTKAKGNRLEKAIVKGLSMLEKITKREYELLVIAKKKRIS
ncbi:MAG: class I SAM-dependent methyltransferase [Nitrospirae bacterium]|nr:class I SAM-dependent methyltransferase [Nitrospirota bacterium]